MTAKPHHGKRPVVVRQTLLASVGVAALYTLYTVYANSVHNSPPFRAGHRSSYLETGLGGVGLLLRGGWGFNLSRAAAAARLEQRVDADPMLGACYEQEALLEGIPEGACKDLRCLWSEAEQQNVDLWLNPLRVLPSEALATKCPRPQGGQGPMPAGRQPLVSFVISMHNNAGVTAQCLLELFRTAREVESAEYVLVNDGSTEDVSPVVQAAARMQQLFGIQFVYIVNEKAQGYGAANTRGIEAASGEFIVLINNDMFVVKGWLAAIVQTFAEQPAAGIVGPVFLGATDMVQEAGGIVFAGAEAANHGRGKALTHRMYYLREVDYISAACIAFRKAVFQRLGGFDSQYEMGYFEDTDLAMTVRASGLKVLLQPLAVVYHQEGTTFGTDASSDFKRQLMVDNRAKFKRKWGTVLQAKHCPVQEGHLIAAMRYASPRVLWIDDIVPEPDKDSGSIRNLNILKILLGEGYHVTLVPTAAGREPRYKARARAMGVDVLTPITLPDKWQFVYRGKCLYDVIYVARRAVYQAAQKQLAKQCPGVPIIYDTVDLHFLREARDVITSLAPPTKTDDGGPNGGASRWHLESVTTARVLEWLDGDLPEAAAVRAKRDMELALIDQADVTVVVSPDEVDVLHHYRPNAKVAVLSNIHEVPLPPKPNCSGRTGLLFVGNMNHDPNRQAVEVLVRDVLPNVLDLLPEAEQAGFMVHVVGANVVPASLLQLFEQHKEHVTFHGYLPDDQLRVLYHNVKVVMAPLLSGAGVKGKVNQAMKLGVPVVATPLAVEGMHARDGQDCLLASDPQDFAGKVVQLYTDCTLWARLVDGGHRNIKQHFSVEMARPVVFQVFSSVGAGPLHSSLRGTCKPLQAHKPQISRKQAR